MNKKLFLVGGLVGGVVGALGGAVLGEIGADYIIELSKQ
jgi:gas vesicle protein